AMFTKKLKAVAAVLGVLALTGLGLAGLAHTMPAGWAPRPPAAAAEDTTPKPAAGQPKVVKDTVEGSIHHGDGKTNWERITGKVEGVNAYTLRFADGTTVKLLTVAPDLDQMAMKGDSLYPAGKEAAEFLRKLVGDQSVTCFLVGAQGKWRGYVGDRDIVHELLVNGWALAQHSGEQPA